MKRTREEVLGVNMEKVLMLLSCRFETKFKRRSSSFPIDVFECKTCNRRFSSFQALGGHRASHKKERTIPGSDEDLKSETKALISKTKTHECSACGLDFSSGQALGGHMRKHRMMNAGFPSSAPTAVLSKMPVLMRSNSKRVMCLNMDLNLTPLENDLKLLFGNMAQKIDTLLS
ncbi:zinc finger protein ZAT11-like [Argentina anserina]|uniref:zinc finger protein ZAT11-like n=1 Tax=Argentina anserina TaxID=57926 RepID=UPI0021767CED|nr:zinc finger protein ZAT11-like [Potentilla anserina]